VDCAGDKALEIAHAGIALRCTRFDWAALLLAKYAPWTVPPDSMTLAHTGVAAMMTAWQAKDAEQRKELAHDALSISPQYVVRAECHWAYHGAGK
jgi:hypothetical protein